MSILGALHRSRSESRGLCPSNMAKAGIDPASRVVVAPCAGIHVTGIPAHGVCFTAHAVYFEAEAA